MRLRRIGLGRMGGNMVSPLMRHKPECILHGLQRRAVDELIQEGPLGVMSLVARTEMMSSAAED